jgi:type VI secretion system FHA domain protein
MSLTLTVLSFKNQPINEIAAVSVGNEGGSIGRSADNTLVLPDTEKFVSRHHATIKMEAGSYYLTDTSLSGISIDGATPLHNETERLAHGMVLKIGEYEIAVAIANQPVIDDSPFFAESTIPEPVPLFTVDETWVESDNLGLNSLMSDNFPLHEELVQSADSYTPSFESSLHANQSPLFDSYIAPNTIIPPVATAEKVPENFSFDDFFADVAPTPIVDKATAVSDDFADSFAAALAGFEPVNEAPVDIGVATRTLAEPEEIVEDNPLFADAQSPVSEPETVTPSEPIPATAVLSSTLSEEDNSEENNSLFTVEPLASKPVAYTESSAKPVADNQLFDAFLQGVAIDCKTIRPEQQADTLRSIGQMFRKLIEGTVAVLRSRAEFKSLCRVNMTVIKATDNNPLKFTVSSDDVLRQLLENKTDGFLASTDAIEQAFNDIMNHQLAMQAGIQASLTDLLQTFDPKLIEKQFEQGLVLQKKSKCWDSYEKTYHNTVEDAVENFFGDAFVEAYERQMKALTKSSKN